jgi:deazaflavin-dependent oxidoreductase (nitroreductase family)
MHGDSSALGSRLREVAEYEATLRHTPLTSALRSLGRTKAFAAVFRRLGPKVDPWLGRRTRGRIAARLYGLPVLLLDTIGSQSGLPRTSPVIYLRDGDDFVVVGTNWGQFHHPAWSGNLLAHPDAEIEVGPVRLAVTAELADQAAWDRLWTRFCAVYPGYANYLQRCGDRVPRMFLLRPTI